MIRIVTALLCCTLPALAASSWDDLRGLRSGDSVKVHDTAGQEHKGTFRAVTAGSISIAAVNGEESIERAKVKRVQVKSSGRRLRNVAIGVGIGLALGLVVDQSLGTYLRNESNESGGARALTYIAPIGIFGGIGAIPAGYKTVYRNR